MVRSQKFFLSSEGPQVEALGLLIAFAASQKLGEVIQAGCGLDLICPYHFPDRESLTGEPLCTIELSHIVGHRGQCVETSRQVGMLRTERLSANENDSLEEFLRFQVSSLFAVKFCQIGQGSRNHWV